MKEFLNAAKVQWLLWKLAVARFILYSLSTLISSFMTANATIVWTNLTNWERFIVILGCIGSWTTTMIAFLDKTSSQIAKGQIPGNPGDTVTISKP